MWTYGYKRHKRALCALKATPSWTVWSAYKKPIVVRSVVERWRETKDFLSAMTHGLNCRCLMNNCIPHFPIRGCVGSRSSLLTDLKGLGILVLSFLMKSRFLNSQERTTLKGRRFCSTTLVCVSFRLPLFLLNTASHIL